MKSKTLTITIRCSPGQVYDFVSDPGNLPEWASTFVQSAREEHSGWVIETTMGPMKVRFAPKNTLGVLDHFLTPIKRGSPPGAGSLVESGGPGPGSTGEIAVPMRVVPNETGCEMIFTIFQTPGMTEEMFSNDAKAVTQDLKNLKIVMEKGKKGFNFQVI